MIFGGLQKLTLLDYPSKVACTVFTLGCDYCCPFCHNSSLVTEKPDYTISEDEVLSFLRKRLGVLDGVCITGGEPLMQDGIQDFIEKVKDIGYLVKLDTNGSYPEKLINLAERKLIDYVAMDIKNSLERYSFTAGKEVDLEKVKKSVEFLKKDTVDYEFRTTVVSGHHDKEAMVKIGEWIKGAKRYYLQSFVDSGSLIGKAKGVGEQEMQELLETVKIYMPNAKLRGI